MPDAANTDLPMHILEVDGGGLRGGSPESDFAGLAAFEDTRNLTYSDRRERPTGCGRKPPGFVARSSHTAPGIVARSPLASGPCGRQHNGELSQHAPYAAHVPSPLPAGGDG